MRRNSVLEPWERCLWRFWRKEGGRWSHDFCRRRAVRDGYCRQHARMREARPGTTATPEKEQSS